MAAKKPLRRYKIRHQGMEIVIETETTKNKSILALFRLLAREIMMTRPQDWNEFMERVNRVDQISDDQDSIEDEDDFDFFKRLMEQA